MPAGDGTASPLPETPSSQIPALAICSPQGCRRLASEPCLCLLSRRAVCSEAGELPGTWELALIWLTILLPGSSLQVPGCSEPAGEGGAESWAAAEVHPDAQGRAGLEPPGGIRRLRPWALGTQELVLVGELRGGWDRNRGGLSGRWLAGVGLGELRGGWGASRLRPVIMRSGKPREADRGDCRPGGQF